LVYQVEFSYKIILYCRQFVPPNSALILVAMSVRSSKRKLLQILTRSMTKAKKPASQKPASQAGRVSTHQEYDEISVPGRSVPWRNGTRKYQWKTLVRISRTKKNGEYYKSVHAGTDTPVGKFVGLYLGDVVPGAKVTVADGRWCAYVPGFRTFYSLDSQISKNWPFKRYLAKGGVGGFFNSSRLHSEISSPINANCKLVWFHESYSPETIHGPKVYAVLVTIKPVRRGEEFLWNYPWI
jgi:hypothetical protein